MSALKNTYGRSLLSYRKTDHFMHRQWERKIDDQLLKEVLKPLKKTFIRKTSIIVSYKVIRKLKRKGLIPDTYDGFRNLIISLQGSTLITLYFENDLYHFFQKTAHHTEFFIL